jgi:hypothetical protein
VASQSRERAEVGGLAGGGPGGAGNVTRGIGALEAASMNLRTAPSSRMLSQSFILLVKRID